MGFKKGGMINWWSTRELITTRRTILLYRIALALCFTGTIVCIPVTVHYSQSCQTPPTTIPTTTISKTSTTSKPGTTKSTTKTTSTTKKPPTTTKTTTKTSTTTKTTTTTRATSTTKKTPTTSKTTSTKKTTATTRTTSTTKKTTTKKTTTKKTTTRKNTTKKTIQKSADQESWLDWTEWSDCSTTCGPGQKYRSRVCVSYSKNDATVCEAGSEAIDVQQCQLSVCTGDKETLTSEKVKANDAGQSGEVDSVIQGHYVQSTTVNRDTINAESNGDYSDHVLARVWHIAT